MLRRGLRETVLDCGGWKVELGLDLAAGPPRGARGNGNYRLTEDVTGRAGGGLSTSTPLRLGKRKTLKAAGGRAELLLEREPGARSGPGLPDADKPATVPLLR